jgi:hypothetical protein
MAPRIDFTRDQTHYESETTPKALGFVIHYIIDARGEYER